MRRQGGFSLVELLFALLILTIVILTTLAVFTERARRLRMASETILAWQVLSNEAEVERRVDFASLAPKTAFTTDTALLGPLAPFTTNITVDSPQAGIKNVTMLIAWQGGRRTASLSIVRVDTGGGNLW